MLNGSRSISDHGEEGRAQGTGAAANQSGCSASRRATTASITQSIFLGQMSDERMRGGGPLVDFTESEVRRLMAYGSVRTVPRGTVLFAQGGQQDSLFVILSGGIRSYFVSSQGKEFTLGFWAPGHLVGAPLDFEDRRHSWSGEAIFQSHVLVLAVNRIERLVREDPGFAYMFIKIISQKSRYYSSLLQYIATSSVKQRLERVLRLFVIAFGVERDGEIFLRFPVTHSDLARLTGSSRQAIQKQIQTLVEAGRVRVHKGRFFIAMNKEATPAGAPNLPGMKPEPGVAPLHQPPISPQLRPK